MHRTLRPAASGALLCALAFALAACGEDDDNAAAPGSTPTSSASSGPTAESSNDLGLPLSPAPGLSSTFPVSEVPLVPGPVTQPVGSGNPTDGWVLEVASAKDRKTCFDEAVAALVEKGFELSAGPITSETNIEALYLSPAYRVIVTATDRDGACALGYEVAQNTPPAQ